MGILISVLFIITCVLLVLVVLLQKGRGGGLGAALGGAGSAAFGTKVGDLMTWVTIVLTVMFLLLAIGAVMYFRPPVTVAEQPIFEPSDQRPIAETIRVSIRKIDEDDTIHYTLDGTEPDRDSEKYSSPFPVSPGTLVKAIAYPQRGDPSTVAEANYLAQRPASPVVSPMPDGINPITAPTSVTITPGRPSDKVYYTTDGEEPTESTRLYTAPITVAPNMTLKIRAFAKNAKPSDIVSLDYGVKTAPIPTIPTTQPVVPTPPVTTAPAL
jgi:protein translocase SecG subunit